MAILLKSIPVLPFLWITVNSIFMRMNKNHITGRQGEEIAASWLIQHGFTVLHRNWRYSHYELDIVAVKGEVLHLIEVKTRICIAFGHPLESITQQKLKRMMEAGEAYQIQNPDSVRVQYDLIGISVLRGGDYVLAYEEDLSL